MSNLETRFLESQETIKSLERSIKVQRTIHDAHRTGCTARHKAMQDILSRVEKQRDDAWKRIEELEQQLRDATSKANDDDADYVFEAHLEGMDCGRSQCGTCGRPNPTGA